MGEMKRHQIRCGFEVSSRNAYLVAKTGYKKTELFLFSKKLLDGFRRFEFEGAGGQLMCQLR